MRYAVLMVCLLLAARAWAGDETAPILGVPTMNVPAEVAPRLEAVQRKAARIRGLAWKKKVQAAYMDKKNLSAFLDKAIREDSTPEEIYGLEQAFKTMGFVGEVFDMMATLKKLLTSQVAGFYHPRSGRMVMIDIADSPAMKQLQMYPAELRKKAENMMLLHEYVHALQDQYYALQKMTDEREEYDDSMTAFTALMEGDATNAMYLYFTRAMARYTSRLMGGVDGNTDAAERKAMKDIVKKMGGGYTNPDALLAEAAGDGKILMQTPRILRESLLFGYTQGMAFTNRLYMRGGNARVNQAFLSPPVSSEQIIHPEKYMDELDLPQVIGLRALPAGVPGTLIRTGTWGELGIAILFRTHGLVKSAPSIAAGWDGDRYVIYAHPALAGAPAKRGLLWVSVWDRDADAREFANGMLSVHKHRFPKDVIVDRTGKRTRVFASGDRLTREGTRVVIVEGAGPHSAVLEQVGLKAAIKEMAVKK